MLCLSVATASRLEMIIIIIIISVDNIWRPYPYNIIVVQGYIDNIVYYVYARQRVSAAGTAETYGDRAFEWFSTNSRHIRYCRNRHSKPHVFRIKIVLNANFEKKHLVL